MNKVVRPERSFWRDETISTTHRDWGFDCPAVDIDFLMVEYDAGRPIAIIEYKHERAPKIDARNNRSYDAIRWLCNKAGIYFFLVRYNLEMGLFKTLSGNPKARELLDSLSANGITHNEEWFVRFLYLLRERDTPKEVIETIRNKDAERLRKAK